MSSLTKHSEFKKHLASVEAYYRSLVPEIAPGFSENYIGGGQSQLEYLGLKVPQVNSLFKHKLDIHTAPPEAQVEYWNYIWHESNCYEVMAAALTYFLHSKRYNNAVTFWPLLKKWVHKVDNWALSDGLSKFFSQCLEIEPQLVLPELRKWNSSRLPWLQRQSLVSLLYYSSSRKSYLPFESLILFVQNHIQSEHMYVQKGVGWTLRELGNVYPSKTWTFLNENICELSAISFSSSTEKLSPEKKAQLKKLRAQRPKASRSRSV